ncbi:MAG: PEP-CTERM sorting domain-containing protein [Hassallia sp.]
MKNTFSTLLISASLALGVAAIATPAQAKQSANEQSGKAATSVMCNISNISLGGTAATDCKGPFEGNDTGATGTLLDDLNQGLFASSVGSNVTWSLAGKSDEPNPFLTADNGLSTGNWSLNKALSSGTFVISLKSSTAYSAYLFKDIDFSKTGLEGIFNTIGVALDGSGKAGKALSHASLFVANVPPEPTKVPEPSALMGLGLVLGGMVVARRRMSATTNF